MLHVAQIGFFNDPAGRRPAELMEAWSSLVDVAEAAASAPDLRVSVIQSSSHVERLNRNGVDYYFLPCGYKDTRGLKLIDRLAPDILHVHGLEFSRQVQALGAMAPQTPILLQDHASRPPRLWRRRSWRRGFRVASGIAFCAREQAGPFAQVGLIQPHTVVYQIPESTSRFTVADQADARRASGLAGEPCLLWVGHLNENKDPLTVLDGVSAAARKLPGLQLWCCFGTAPLLPKVQARIAGDPQLSGRVHLLGRVPHERIEVLMRAADLFVSGSHREGSGYAVIEALACGLPPVVTDIPSFRALTGDGKAGRLWRCADPQDLSDAIVHLAAQPRVTARQAARAQFDAELSCTALGQKLRTVYRGLISRNSPGHGGLTS